MMTAHRLHNIMLVLMEKLVSTDVTIHKSSACKHYFAKHYKGQYEKSIVHESILFSGNYKLGLSKWTCLFVHLFIYLFISV